MFKAFPESIMKVRQQQKGSIILTQLITSSTLKQKTENNFFLVHIDLGRQYDLERKHLLSKKNHFCYKFKKVK